jgi:ribosomal protein S12 methylthiotransferase
MGAEPEKIRDRKHPNVLAITGPQQYESVMEAVHGALPPRTIPSSTWCRRRASS